MSAGRCVASLRRVNAERVFNYGGSLVFWTKCPECGAEVETVLIRRLENRTYRITGHAPVTQLEEALE